ncbi:MAG: hypothetical protein ACWA6U_07845 [Breznakibacter sp.]
MTTEIKLESIKKVFHDRHLKTLLIERTGKTRRNINHVLNGRHKNRAIIDAALIIIEEEKKKFSKIKLS